MESRLRADPSRHSIQIMEQAGRLYRGSRLSEAASLCRALVAAEPDHAEAHHLLGVLTLDRGDPEAALPLLERAAVLAPATPRIAYHRGNALLALHRLVEAEACFRAALASAPGFTPALNNLGNALRAMDRDAEAVACYRTVLAREPGHAPALYNMGLALRRLGRFEEAAASLRRVLSARVPAAQAQKLIEVRETLIGSLADAGCDDEALATARGLLAERPDNLPARFGASLLLLRLGRYREAWPDYEARWMMPGFREPIEMGRPVPAVLDLDRVDGKRVLVRGEQGRGDIIQFVRYVPLLAQRGAQVSLTSPFPELAGLLRSVPGVAAVTESAPQDPPCDVDTGLLSLPLAFGTELHSVPAHIPYLFADPDRIAAWAGILGPRDAARIALCWRGSAHSRSSAIPLAQLAPLLGLAGLSMHAIQREITDADRALLASSYPGVKVHSEALEDFAHTAALLLQMDLVISNDTAIAHLAGALGKPVWIMLRRSPDWRWLKDRDDSPWYPTARLFRQRDADGWDALAMRVRSELIAWQQRHAQELMQG